MNERFDWTWLEPNIYSSKKSVQNGWMVNLSKNDLTHADGVSWSSELLSEFFYSSTSCSFMNPRNTYRKKINSFFLRLNSLHVLLQHHCQFFEIIYFALKFWQHKQAQQTFNSFMMEVPTIQKPAHWFSRGNQWTGFYMTENSVINPKTVSDY